jgi:hypothetical protein
MSTLGRWLAGILNAHIERDNVPVAEPVPDSPLARFYIGQLDLEPEVLTVEVEIDTTRFDAALRRATARIASLAPRPCWACGDPVGFHAFHRPCWNVPPFKRDAEQSPRTYGAGSVL